MLLFLFPAPSVVPINLTAHPTGNTTVHVTWRIEDLEPGFILRHYVISYRKLEHGDVRNDTKEFTGSEKNEATLEGLLPFTTYEIKVAAATNLIGNYSKPVNVTTKEGGRKRIQLSRGNERKKNRSLIIEPVHYACLDEGARI